jgi:hypothetical protein
MIPLPKNEKGESNKKLFLPSHFRSVQGAQVSIERRREPEHVIHPARVDKTKQILVHQYTLLHGRHRAKRAQHTRKQQKNAGFTE